MKVLSKEKYIEEKKKSKPIIHGEYSIFDDTYRLWHVNTKSKFSISIEDTNIVAHVPEESLPDGLVIFFKNILKMEATNLVQELAQQHNFCYNKIFIKEIGDKRGICSYLKNLTFNWRLVFAPKIVLRYVVVHELCHLKEMSHNDRFWKLVAEVFPNYEISLQWLKEHDHIIYQYLPHCRFISLNIK